LTASCCESRTPKCAEPERSRNDGGDEVAAATDLTTASKGPVQGPSATRPARETAASWCGDGGLFGGLLLLPLLLDLRGDDARRTRMARGSDDLRDAAPI
jgi:hypothetical protein